MKGLDRTRAARWVGQTTGYPVSLGTIRYWEEIGLLRLQSPGHRVPAEYRVSDLVQLRLVTELRREGAPLERLRLAVRNLARFIPRLRDRSRVWDLAVLSNGDVVRSEGLTLSDLTARPGRTGWAFYVPAHEYIEDAEHAIEEHAAVGALA